MNLIKKKDNKLQEINMILENEVNPQLEQLRRDKETYAIFKSNESQIEELDKILTAFEFYEYDKILKDDDQGGRRLREEEKKI
jgi:structural maintenance of chromosome 2